MKQGNNNIRKKIINLVDKHPYKAFFGVILLIPLVVQFFLWVTSALNIFVTASNDGWLGFWGSYLGSIVAIGGVYWQVNRQSRQDRIAQRKSFQFEINQSAKQCRPRFILQVVDLHLFGKKYYLNDGRRSQTDQFVKWVEELHKNGNDEFTVLKIENVGNEAIINARLKMLYKRKLGGDVLKQECIILPVLKPDETFIYVPAGTQTQSNDAKKITNVDIWITTASGEEICCRLENSFGNGIFNTWFVDSDIDNPNSSNFSNSNRVFDGIKKVDEL